MKRIYKIILIVLGILSSSIALVVLLAKEKPTTYHIGIIPKCIYLGKEESNFSVDFYDLDREAYGYFNKDNINHIYLLNGENDANYNLDLKSVELVESPLYNGKKIDIYRLNLDFPLSEEKATILGDAYIEIHFASQEKWNMYLGSFLKSGEILGEELNVRSLKADYEKDDKGTYLSMIYLKLATKEDVEINEIEIVNSNVALENPLIKINDQESNELPVHAQPFDAIDLNIPLSTKDTFFRGQIGLIIRYDSRGEEKEFVLPFFMFCKDLQDEEASLKVYEYTINQNNDKEEI